MSNENETITQGNVDSKTERKTTTETPAGTETRTETTIVVQGPRHTKKKFFGLGAVAGVALGVGGTVAYQRYGDQLFGNNG